MLSKLVQEIRKQKVQAKVLSAFFINHNRSCHGCHRDSSR